MAVHQVDDGAERSANADRATFETCLKGTASAFNSFVLKHQVGVWNLARRYLKSDADAADVTQQTFVRAYRGLASYRGDATPRSWLYRIAINCSLTWLRDHKREVATEIDDNALTSDPSSPTQLLSVERATQLRLAIAQLPTKQRQVVELRIFDELSFREVASIAQCNENTAKVNYHHALKQLRELLNETSASGVEV
jgi:RNA polymerase sigma-70 factor, ECF subfamily